MPRRNRGERLRCDALHRQVTRQERAESRSAEGATKGQAFKITKSPVVIGRKEGDMIVHDGRVSSKHAQLDVAGARIYTLKDLASTNGTTINDRPISVGHLEDGDVISFGGVKFEFRAKMTG